jgi:nitrate/TMAO reductase-like tetraheme cytochrome c subunit
MWLRFKSAVRNFFFPPPEKGRFYRVLPYLTLGLLTGVVLIAGVYTWEYTNSSEFCGTSCHTMPPEYTSYLTSPHARVDCVECHIGRDFVATRIGRKAGDLRHIFAQTFTTYEYPIRAHTMRPARETCERCHFPEKFSDDSLREIRTFEDDLANTPTSIYLTLKTGGGTAREGLGRGIHWHIENEINFYATDPEQQDIPYVQVISQDGQVTEYLDIESGFDPAALEAEDLQRMDCITCHNRITHLVPTPENAVDEMMTRGSISPRIPEIRRKSIEILRTPYSSKEQGLKGIEGLRAYYQQYYAEFYAVNNEKVDAALAALQSYYDTSVFPEQKSDWDSHTNNLGHTDDPGCFRCHDGKHLNAEEEAIRLECNLCHSIPVVAGPSDFVANIELSRGPEPESHLNPNWIGIHREVFDSTCENCHTTGNPGGTDDTSFCANSACHGTVWEYAGFNAPALREILLSQLPEPEEPVTIEGPVTFASAIGPLFRARCTSCHGEGGIQGLNLTSYAGAMSGGISGPAIIAGNPNKSLIIQRQTGDKSHFSQFSPDEMDLLIGWIENGAPEG